MLRRSFDHPDAVTEEAERAKILKYQHTEWAAQGIFHPFAMTSTGKIGARGIAALQFLKAQYELGDDFIHSLCKQLSRICMTRMTQMVIAGRIALRSRFVIPALSVMVGVA